MSKFRISGVSRTPGSPVRRHGIDCGPTSLVAMRINYGKTEGVIVLHIGSRRSLHGARGMGSTYEPAHMLALHATQFEENTQGWTCKVPFSGAEFQTRGWREKK